MRNLLVFWSFVLVLEEVTCQQYLSNRDISRAFVQKANKALVPSGEPPGISFSPTDAANFIMGGMVNKFEDVGKELANNVFFSMDRVVPFFSHLMQGLYGEDYRLNKKYKEYLQMYMTNSEIADHNHLMNNYYGHFNGDYGNYMYYGGASENLADTHSRSQAQKGVGSQFAQGADIVGTQYGNVVNLVTLGEEVNDYSEYPPIPIQPPNLQSLVYGYSQAIPAGQTLYPQQILPAPASTFTTPPALASIVGAPITEPNQNLNRVPGSSQPQNSYKNNLQQPILQRYPQFSQQSRHYSNAAQGQSQHAQQQQQTPIQTRPQVIQQQYARPQAQVAYQQPQRVLQAQPQAVHNQYQAQAQSQPQAAVHQQYQSLPTQQQKHSQQREINPQFVAQPQLSKTPEVIPQPTLSQQSHAEPQEIVYITKEQTNDILSSDSKPFTVSNEGSAGNFFRNFTNSRKKRSIDEILECPSNDINLFMCTGDNFFKSFVTDPLDSIADWATQLF